MALLELHSGNTGAVHTNGASFGHFSEYVKNSLKFVQKAHMISRERHQLLELDDERLKDLGLTKEQADKEANRPFWDLP